MAETESKVDAETFESRLAAVEKSLIALGKRQSENSLKLRAVHTDVIAAVDSCKSTAGMLAEIMTLTRRAAPLLDSPMARMAQSPAGAGLMNLVGKVQRHGR